MAALSLKLGEVKRQASGFLQDKYKQARLALADVTPAELLVQEATNNDTCIPDARTLACIADAAFDMDDYWRIANVLHRRLGCVDWKEWRPVYKALVVLEFLLTHGPDELPRDFLADMPALRDLRSFNYTDDKGFDWGACMQRRSDTVLALLTDADRLKDARRRAIRVSHEVQHGSLGSPTSSSSPSSASSSSSSSRSTWSFASSSPHYSDSPTLVCLCTAPDTDYRHDKKFDAVTADDRCRTAGGYKHLADEDEDAAMDDDPCITPRTGRHTSWFEDTFSPTSFTRKASGFQSLSQPERRAATKFQRQLSMDY